MKTHTGTCHCGAVAIEVDLDEDGFTDLRRCDCSLCRRKGAIMASVPRGRLRVVRGEDALRLYQWNTGVAEHWFCGTCGIYTHHRRRSNPDEYGFNTGCFEGVDPALLAAVGMGAGAGSTLSLTEDEHKKRRAEPAPS